MQHNLQINSLNDASADCSCGFHFVTAGESTAEDIQKIHDSLL